MERFLLLGMLAVYSREDIKTGTLPVRGLLLGGAAGVGIYLYMRPCSVLSLAGGIGVGLVLLLFAAVSRGSIGSGDGYLLCVTGIFLGFWDNLALLMSALLFSAGFAGILLLIKRCGRKEKIPFVPFVLAAYLVFLAGEGGR